MKNKLFTIILLLVILSISVFAKNIALLIGLDDYRYLPNLRFAQKDAQDLETVLKKAGFDTVLLTGERISRDTILEEIKYITEYSSYSDTLLFFFSGHGAGGSTETEKGLLTYYSDPNSRNAMVSHADLKESISNFKGKKIVVVDACNQGYETKGQMVRTQDLQNAVDFLLFSSASNQESHDGFREGNIHVDNGIAAYYLKKAIEGYADLNADNTLSAGELKDYLKNHAQFYANLYGQYMEVYNRSDTERLILLGEPTYDSTGSTKLVVLSVGINEYLHKANLSSPVHDAEVFASVMREKYSADKVILLTDEQATKKGILSAFDTVESDLDKNTTFLFYYSGSGTKSDITEESQFSLFVYDSNIKSYAGNTISREEMTDLASRFSKKTKNTVFIIDTCFSARAVLEPETISNFLLLASSDYNDYSLDGGNDSGHSLYTYFLLKGLQGSADNRDDGRTETIQLHEYILKGMANLSEDYDRYLQTPVMIPRKSIVIGN